MDTFFFESKKSQCHLTVNIGELVPGSLLRGKVVLITGSTDGIGLCIARKCILQGAKVIVTGRNEGKLRAAKEKLGENCYIAPLDVTQVASFSTFLENISEQVGRIDCLVNNAGISLHEGSFQNVTENSWDQQMNTNLKGPFFLTQAWLNYYEKKRMTSGRIVMMASDTSGMGSTLPYGLTKVAISSFTRGLAKHIIRKGIRINAIAPGTTKTKMTDDFTHGEIVRESTEGYRVLFPDEIAEICVFLLSDASTCISGNVFGCTEANICFDNASNAYWGEQETNP